MPRQSLRQKDVENPERILMQLIRDYVEGRLGGGTIFYRASIVKVDNVGGVLAGPGTPRPLEPPNPRGSVVARVLTDALDIYSTEDDLTVFWPMWSHDQMPIKESEHIYVIFEDLETREHGLWLSRIPEPNDISNLNITPGTKRYTEDASNNLQPGGAAEKAVQDSATDPGVAKVTKDFDTEPNEVPEYNSRVGDRVIHGSNNTAIIFSRDRIDDPSSGKTKKAGTIDIVAGRELQNGNPSQTSDKSRIYLTMKSDVDTNFSVNKIGEASGDVAAIVVKSDEIRVIARKGIKIVSESGPTTIVIDEKGTITATGKIIDLVADKVKVGSANANHPLVYGDGLKKFLETTLKDILASALVDVAGSPGMGIINPAIKVAITSAFATWDKTVQTKDYTVK